MLAEKAILDLRAPVLRVTGYDVPYPVLDDRGRVPAVASSGSAAAAQKRPAPTDGRTSSSFPTSARGWPRARSPAGSSRSARRSPRTTRSSRSRPTRRPSRFLAGRGHGCAHPRRGGRARRRRHAARRDRRRDGELHRPSRGAPPHARQAERVQATPLVRRIAAELGVDLASLPAPVRAAGSPRRTSGASSTFSGGQTPGRGPERRVPLRGVRRLIAEHLATAHREVPAVTVVEECDFTALAEVARRALLRPLPAGGGRRRA